MSVVGRTTVVTAAELQLEKKGGRPHCKEGSTRSVQLAYAMPTTHGDGRTHHARPLLRWANNGRCGRFIARHMRYGGDTLQEPTPVV